jgi:hypothetical protein
MNVLDRVEEIAKATPPVENAGSRFGNPAFRTFYDKVAEVRRYLPCPRSDIDYNKSM